MTKYVLQNIESNKRLKSFLKKPKFLSEKDEKKLLKFIKTDNLKEFYNLASKLIKNSSDVTNLYVYLFTRLESLNLSNEEIKNQVCWRLFANSSIGWLSVYDPDIINFCKENATDKALIKELESIEIIEWHNEYLELVDLERQISYELEDLETIVEKYFDFIYNLLRCGKISQKKFDEVIKRLQRETSIYKGDHCIGSLITESLQEKLGFSLIAPKLTLSKSDTNSIKNKSVL